MKIKAVIFDMDGVVVNTEPVGYRADNDLFTALNIQVPDDVYATFVGTSPINNMQRLKELYNLPLSFEELLAKRQKYYFDVFDAAQDIHLMPGVLDLIKNLRQNGMMVILASSAVKIKINKILDRFDLHPYFDKVISGEDFEFSKPNPAIFIEAVAQSGFSKNECIIIEDSANGIQAANAAGVYCIAYVSNHGLAQDTTGADKIITDFSALDYLKISNLNIK
ncbi:HAD-IA family hydrolase [Flavobacterium sp. Sd200]|uniref:HAD family hydrolase n=1 Tax=Flavobacterium sp. Sd200 TaxID=2692211 RepID=UPI00136E4AF5|nr:HAD family phosphatase [Flavobacterium sp. Sd200]MXN90445.1 HAD-IA family hydrolase [Flavobacterium sp. Sd200]